MNNRPSRRAVLAAVFALCLALVAGRTEARTMYIDAPVDAAVISAEAPRMSWASWQYRPGLYVIDRVILGEETSMLVRFDLGSIPEGMRVVNAELLIPPITHSQRLFVWRVLRPWGAGVCHLYAVAAPEKIEWTSPGAGGSSSDRATRPTTVKQIEPDHVGEREVILNVTSDVEMWHAGAAANNGWLLTVEDPGAVLQFYSTFFPGSTGWRLRVTYEPE